MGLTACSLLVVPTSWHLILGMDGQGFLLLLGEVVGCWLLVGRKLGERERKDWMSLFIAEGISIKSTGSSFILWFAPNLRMLSGMQVCDVAWGVIRLYFVTLEETRNLGCQLSSTPFC